jgi:hypothetical protein
MNFKRPDDLPSREVIVIEFSRLMKLFVSETRRSFIAIASEYAMRKVQKVGNISACDLF